MVTKKQLVEAKASELAQELERWARENKILAPGEKITISIKLPAVDLSLSFESKKWPESDDPGSLIFWDMPVSIRARRRVENFFRVSWDSEERRPTLADVSKMTRADILSKNAGIVSAGEIMSVLQHYGLSTSCVLWPDEARQLVRRSRSSEVTN